MIPHIRILHLMANGSVSITTPQDHMLESDVDVYAHRIDAHLKEQGAIPNDWPMIAVVSPDDVPVDRTFRDAWEFKNGVSVNFDKAKELTKARLRREREPLLKSLDIQFIKALEKGEPTESIVAEKQRLRDLPTLADSSKDIDALKLLKP